MVGFSNIASNVGGFTRGLFGRRSTPPPRTPTQHGANYGSDTANDALAMYGQTYGTQPSPPTQYDQAFAAYGAPAMGAADLALAQLRQQYGMLMAGQGVDKDYLNQQYGFLDKNKSLDLASLGLDRTNLGLQDQYLNSQISNQEQLANLEAGNLFLDEQRLGEYEQLANQIFGLEEGNIKRQSENQLRKMQSDAVSRGAIGSSGYASDAMAEEQDLSSALSGLSNERQKSALDFLAKRAGIDQAKEGTRLGFQGKQQKFAYDKAQLGNAQKQLDLEAQRIGLSSQEARAKLDNALAQLGIQGSIDANGILIEMSKIDQGLLSSLPPQILSAIRALTGLGVR